MIYAVSLDREEGLQDDLPRLGRAVGYQRHALAELGVVSTAVYLVFSPARSVVGAQRRQVSPRLRKSKSDVIALTGISYFASSHHFIAMRGSCVKGTIAIAALRQNVRQRATDSTSAGCEEPRERTLG